MAAVAGDFSGKVLLLPTGEGQSRTIRFPSLHAYRVSWLPDGKHLVLSASDAGKGSRLYLVDLETEASRPISPEGSGMRVSPVSPDGSLISARGTDGNTWLFPTAGGTPRKAPGFAGGRRSPGLDLRWESRLCRRDCRDGKCYFPGGSSNGQRRDFQTVGPLDKAGLTYVSAPNLTPDGKYYVYSYNRQISELFVADGIK